MDSSSEYPRLPSAHIVFFVPYITLIKNIANENYTS
jgi:hypothetical protein